MAKQGAADLLPVLRAASAELTPEERAAPILVGVSGGPDSLALLHALGRWRAEGGPAIAAIHVDHGLRPGSADEARQVAAWCAARGIPFAGRVAGLARVPMANIEQLAREARYRCFAEEAARVGALTLALAHHADDQAETVLLHLLRGSGLAGLAGMPVVRRAGDLLDPLCAALGVARPAVWRPLLAVRRAAILAYCARWQLTPLHDPSNDDTALRRNAVRHRIMPVLEEFFPGAGGILARNAALLAADEDFLQAATDGAFARCDTAQSGVVVLGREWFRREHLAVQRRLLRAIWGHLRGLAAPVGLDADVVEAARTAIVGGKTGARHDLPGDLLLLLDRADAALGPAATLEGHLRRRHGLPLAEPGWQTPWPLAGTFALADGWSVAVQQPAPDTAQALTLQLPAADANQLTVRTWQPGDRVALPSGRSRKLQDWFTDRQVPAYLRHHLPLLARGDRVLWIVGLAAFPTPATVVVEAGERAACGVRLLYNGTSVEPVRQQRTE